MSPSTDNDNPENVQSDTLRRVIGLAMALASTVFGILYLIGIGVNLATSGSVYPSGSDVRMISAAVALLWNVALLVLFTTLRREAEPSRAILAELALVFAILVCWASCASWFTGMTAYPRIAQAEPVLAAFLDPYNPDSFTYALEHLGWGLFFGMATLLAGMSLPPRGVSPRLAWSLMATGVLSLAHFIGVVIGQNALIAMGYVSWGVALPIASALLAKLYRQELAQPGG